ncbi:MAG: hypothetical protein CL666_14630 [Balneola sp.]|nr:hypothetical protein [Balneola sp.]|tara:strand:+ start:61643 stop:61891 length:249 start_codon:yes stop_codon:yes gene_type:complete
MSEIKEDRATIEEILDNPGGVFPTDDCYDRLVEYVRSVRTQAVGWTWAEACTQLDKGEDPRQYDQAKLIERSEKELNIEFQQ